MPIVLQPVMSQLPPELAPGSAQDSVEAVVSKTIDEVPLPERLQAVRITAGMANPLVEWTMRDPAGRAVDLTTCEGIISIVLRMTDGTEIGVGQGIYEFPGVVVEPVIGLVSAHVDPLIIGGAGVWDGSFAVINEAGVIFENTLKIIVDRSMWGPDAATFSGPPTIKEIRLRMRDSSYAENRLLDIVAYDEAEIATAIIAAVDDWNDSPPMDEALAYTVHTFPFRRKWIEAVIGYLHLIEGEAQLRNQLAVSAGGITVDDQNKAPMHFQLGNQMLADYRKWVLQTKGKKNLDRAYSEVGSPYSHAALGRWG